MAVVNALLDHIFTTATCFRLSGPGNGGITFDKSPIGHVNYKRYPVGTVGSYYCNSGYIHSGAISATCKFRGGWSSIGTGPICTGIIKSRSFSTQLLKSAKIDS